MSDLWPEEHDSVVFGEFLHHLYEPPDGEGPPFVHTLELPESEEEMRADPAGIPQHTLSEEVSGRRERGSGGVPAGAAGQ